MTDESGTNGQALEMPKFCGSCHHWKARPIDPNNLGAVRQGECREGPPSLTIVFAPNGQQLQISGYPGLPVTFPACDRHLLTTEVRNLRG